MRLTVQYKGTNYCGWQIQNKTKRKNLNKERTVQEEIEKVLKKVLREKIKLTGACRTDSGVHALAQVANFKTRTILPFENIHKALNSLLSRDIAIKSIKEEKEDFHSRFQSAGKIYQYRILNSPVKDAFEKDFVWQIPRCLDWGKIERGARYLIGRRDFSSFSSAGSSRKNRVCFLQKIQIKHKKGLYLIEIEGDNFLYKMVRNIVGTLVEVGRGRFSPSEIKKILKKKDRKFAGPCAPARGLFLCKVRYK